MDLFCAVLTTVFELASPLIYRQLTDLGLYNPAALSLSFIARLGAIYLGLRIIEIGAQYFMQSIGHIMGAMIEKDLRRDLFAKLQTLSDNFYNDNKVGQLMSRMTTDLNEVTEFAHHSPEEYFIAAVKIVISFIILIRINLGLTLVIYATIPLMIYASSKFRGLMKESFMNQRHQLGELNADIEDTLLGVREVKAYTNEEMEAEKFSKGNKKFLDIKKDTYRNMASFHSVNRIFDGLINLLVIVIGGLMVGKGTISPGDLIAYVLYVTTLLMTVRRIVEFTEAFHRGITGIERFFEIMDVEPEIVDRPGAVELDQVEGSIVFENVDFKYRPEGAYVLKDFNLEVSPGKSLAIVGPSGGGKSTVCNLIPRFYDVSGGSIKIDGVDIRDFTIQSLRSSIGMVSQEVYLFSGSVYDNIEYGKPGASHEEIVQAAKRAGAYDFIMDLEEGFDTYVGERGVRLSGGQRQRISIARVFLKNPPILILDEATSALDNTSERLIQRSLDELAKGRTTITIAHRLSTIQEADKIVYLTDKGIQEIGNHSQLIDLKGHYYDLWQVIDQRGLA